MIMQLKNETSESNETPINPAHFPDPISANRNGKILLQGIARSLETQVVIHEYLHGGDLSGIGGAGLDQER